jgi:hypothetical protein
MTIPFPSAEDSNGNPQRKEKKQNQNSDRRKLVLSLRLGCYRGLVANSLKWQSSDCYYAVTLAVNSVWILLIDLKSKSPHLS